MGAFFYRDICKGSIRNSVESYRVIVSVIICVAFDEEAFELILIFSLDLGKCAAGELDIHTVLVFYKGDIERAAVNGRIAVIFKFDFAVIVKSFKRAVDDGEGAALVGDGDSTFNFCTVNSEIGLN